VPAPAGAIRRGPLWQGLGFEGRGGKQRCWRRCGRRRAARTGSEPVCPVPLCWVRGPVQGRVAEKAVFPACSGAHSGLTGAVGVICWRCTCSLCSSRPKGHPLSPQAKAAVPLQEPSCLLVKGKSSLFIGLLKSAELASGFLFDLEKMRRC